MNDNDEIIYEYLDNLFDCDSVVAKRSSPKINTCVDSAKPPSSLDLMPFVYLGKKFYATVKSIGRVYILDKELCVLPNSKAVFQGFYDINGETVKILNVSKWLFNKHISEITGTQVLTFSNNQQAIICDRIGQAAKIDLKDLSLNKTKNDNSKNKYFTGYTSSNMTPIIDFNHLVHLIANENC